MSTNQHLCRVCGDSAKYSYYGAIVCHPCKIFFRRYATKSPFQKKFQCIGENRCEINQNNRHLCCSCRLSKCFTMGMSTELIQAHRSVKTPKKISSPKLRVSNILKNNQRSLTFSESNFLIELIDSFDQHCPTTFIDNFIHQQNSLPLKLRFRLPMLKDFFTSLIHRIQLICQHYRSFHSLSPHDRSILFHSTLHFTSLFGLLRFLQQSHCFTIPVFVQSFDQIFASSSSMIFRLKSILDEAHFDETFVKLALLLLAFLPTTDPMEFNSPKTLVAIKGMYIDLTWKYLCAKYNDAEAVKCFSELTRCMLLIHTSIMEVEKVEDYQQMIKHIRQLN